MIKLNCQENSCSATVAGLHIINLEVERSLRCEPGTCRL